MESPAWSEGGLSVVLMIGGFRVKNSIYSVFHKKYWCPSDVVYTPIQVGFADDLSIPERGVLVRDNTGDNISDRNASYCELTAVYWVWKNVTGLDYVGFDHYRRHFCLKKTRDKKNSVITGQQLEKLVASDVVILPQKRHYWIETNYSQYVHAHHEIDLMKTREILAEKYPDYLAPYDRIMKKTSGHRFNMFIMPWNIFCEYCAWLFDILFELEKRLDISSYSQYDARVFGFIGERLLDVYLDKNAIKTKEIPYVFMDDEKWGRKIINFLKRKIVHK